MAKIAVDLMGGDNAPEAIEEGILEAVEKFKDVEILAFGLAGSYSGNHPRITFTEVTEKIESDDDPVKAVRRKKDSSLVRAVKAVADGEADAIVSAGNTGAIMSAGLFGVKRIKGIERPAITSMLPTTSGKGVLMLDMGANSENKPKHLLQFAQMASIYMENIEGRKNPSIGLINNGSEEIKGTELTKETYQLLKNSRLNFAGFYEPTKILTGDIDIAVTDGFTGNIVLKTIEGTSSSLMGELKKIMLKNPVNKIAAIALKKDFQGLKDMLDYRQFGGAPLMGLQGNVIKAHGSSDATAVVNAIRQAQKIVDSKTLDKIKDLLGESNE